LVSQCWVECETARREHSRVIDRLIEKSAERTGDSHDRGELTMNAPAFASSSAAATNGHEDFQVNCYFDEGVFVGSRRHHCLLDCVCGGLAAGCDIDQAHRVSRKPRATAAILGVSGDRLHSPGTWPAIAVSAQSRHHSTCGTDCMERCVVVHNRPGLCALGTSHSRTQ